MKRANEQNDQILEAARAELNASKDDLQRLQIERDTLRDQIAESSKRGEDLMRIAAVSGYNQIKRAIATELDKNYGNVDQLLNTLGETLNDPRVESEAIKDAADKSERWDVRVAINLQLFKRKSNLTYLENARSLAVQNKRLVGSVVAGIFTPRFGGLGGLSDQQSRMTIPVIASLILDDGFRKDFRDRLLGAFQRRFGFSSSEVLDGDSVTKLAVYAGTKLVETARGTRYAVCYEVKTLLDTLDDLSLVSEREYAAQALKNAGGNDDRDKQCIKDELEKAVAGRRSVAETSE